MKARKPQILILEKTGEIDSKEFDTLDEATRVFSRLIGLFEADPYERAIRLIDEHGKPAITFDSATGKTTLHQLIG